MNKVDRQGILDRNSDKYISHPGVTLVGVGLRNKKLCFVVVVASEEVQIELPDTVEGLPVVREIAVFRETKK